MRRCVRCRELLAEKPPGVETREGGLCGECCVALVELLWDCPAERTVGELRHQFRARNPCLG